MGTAFKNKGVQLLLDGVTDYLPCPIDVTNYALDLEKEEERLALPCSRCVTDECGGARGAWVDWG